MSNEKSEIRFEGGIIDWADRKERWNLPTDIDGKYDEPKRYGIVFLIYKGDELLVRLETPMHKKLTREEAGTLLAKLESL